MNEQFFDCLKRERDIHIKPKLRDEKSAFRWNPTLSQPGLNRKNFFRQLQYVNLGSIEKATALPLPCTHFFPEFFYCSVL